MAKGRPSMKRERRKEKSTLDIQTWEPVTQIGKLVKSGEINSIDQILAMNKPILEAEIIDALFPVLETETLQVKSTQRVTDSGKRTSFRAVVAVGDGQNHVGLGVGKSEELRPAIEYALKNAKKNMICVNLGSGSWEGKRKGKNSLPRKTFGKEGSTIVELIPAPEGVGLAANAIVKRVLSLGGIKDIWSHTRGGKNNYNMAVATIKAIDKLNKIKQPAA